MMGPGPLLAGAGWMTVGLPHRLKLPVTVHSRECLPIPSPASCLVPCAAACSKCRDSSRGGLLRNALAGLICPQTVTMSRSWELDLLHPKVLCTLRVAVSLEACTEAAGMLQVTQPLEQSQCYHLCLQTPGLHMPLSRGHTDAVQVGAQGSSWANPSGPCFQTLGGAWNIAVQLTPFYSRKTGACVMAEELWAVLGDTIPGDTAGISIPLTSPHTSLLQNLIY